MTAFHCCLKRFIRNGFLHNTDLYYTPPGLISKEFSRLKSFFRDPLTKKTQTHNKVVCVFNRYFSVIRTNR